MEQRRNFVGVMSLGASLAFDNVADFPLPSETEDMEKTTIESYNQYS